ncbi:MAG: polysaccharide deacetylase family protein [Armatimonadota bacterium]
MSITLIASLIILCLLVTGASAQPLPPLRMTTQQLDIEFAADADAERATISFAPVYDNRDWAFSARWDDTQANSLNMREHMTKYGLKGTFYLTQPDAKRNLDAAWARKLQEGGCSIGGHSLTHPDFATLTPSEIYYQVLANKIEWEDLLDSPLNSFAFAYGRYKSPDNPAILQASTEALQRAGYLHCVYSDFVKNNPHLSPGEISTGNQVVPGDKVVEADKFQEILEKIVNKWPDAFRKQSSCIFLGVHAWQAGEEWDKLDALFDTLANKPDWWYCSHTEWAAYARQVAQSKLEASPISGATRRYTVTRPLASEVGAAVPLTCVVTGAAVRSVKLSGQPFSVDQRDAATILNLPPVGALPQRIGRIDTPATSACAEFPGLKLALTPDLTARKLTLTITADSDLRDLAITFRLPLQYQPGLFTRDLASLAAGTTQTIDLPLPPARPEPVWSEGTQYFAAELDFATPTTPGRVWVTTHLP